MRNFYPGHGAIRNSKNRQTFPLLGFYVYAGMKVVGP
jgi:hypothetical protein